MKTNKRIMAAVLCLMLFPVTGCSKNISYTGNYCQVSGSVSNRVCYEKDYLLMDCCEEWDDFLKTGLLLDGVTAIEGFEYYLYDKNGNKVTEQTVTIRYTVTDEFKERNGDHITVYNLSTKDEFDASMSADGTVTFETDEDGIFLIAKIGDRGNHPVWVTNPPDCNEQCSTCSDEW